MNEEEKAIEFLKNKTTNYSLSGEELHYYLILYYLIINLQKENNQLKEQLEASEKARKDVYDYINFLVIIDTQLAGGRFKDTIWGKELLEILDIDKGDKE